MAKAPKNNGNKSALEVIDSRIKAIETKGKALRNDCHNTLVMVIDHYIAHGDMTRLAPLTAAVRNALGNSMSAAMNLWVARFVPSLVWDKDDGAFKHDKSKEKTVLSVPEDKPILSKTAKGPDGKPARLFGDARQIVFWELQPETKQDPFDFGKTLHDLLFRAKKALDDKRTKKAGARDIINLDEAKLERLLDMCVELGYVKPDEWSATERVQPETKPETNEQESPLEPAKTPQAA